MVALRACNCVLLCCRAHGFVIRLVRIFQAALLSNILVVQHFRIKNSRMRVDKGSKGWRRLRLACETLKV